MRLVAIVVGRNPGCGWLIGRGITVVLVMARFMQSMCLMPICVSIARTIAPMRMVSAAT